MKIRKTKKGFILKDSGLSIRFNSYEYSQVLNDVSLYQDDVLMAIYSNREKFEEQIRVAKGNDYQS